MESEFFIDEIVRTLRKITQDLTPQQVRAFYDSSSTSFEVKQHAGETDCGAMSLPNQAWEKFEVRQQDGTLR